MTRRIWLRSAWLIGFLALPTLSRAELPSQTVLSWSAPPECPQAVGFRASVERLLRQSLETRRDQDLQITAIVSGDGTSGFHASLRMTGAHGSELREIGDKNCEQLTEAAALVTALAIDPALSVAEPTLQADSLARSRSGVEVPATSADLDVSAQRAQSFAPLPDATPLPPIAAVAEPRSLSARPESKIVRSSFVLTGSPEAAYSPESAWALELGRRAERAAFNWR